MALEAHNMEYNSSKDHLIIPEYGRNVQLLVQHCTEIADDDERQAFASKLVDLIQQMHPQYKNVEEYRSKIWIHLFRISNYELNVETPSGEVPTREQYDAKPEPLEYPVSKARFRHYGNNVQILINKALEMEEGPVRDGFVQVIGSYMKLAYKTWNKDHYVSDDVVKSDLKSLSKGLLVLGEDVLLNKLNYQTKRRPSSSSSGGRRSNYGRSGGRSNNRGGSNSGGRGRSNGRYGGGNNRRRK